MTKEEALKRLRELADKWDAEAAHVEADGILIDFLRAIGHGGIADAFDNLQKWYG